jgi:hypothetical protein
VSLHAGTREVKTSKYELFKVHCLGLHIRVLDLKEFLGSLRSKTKPSLLAYMYKNEKITMKERKPQRRDRKMFLKRKDV